MGPQGPGPARINGRARVLAFWLERNPHISPPQDLGQSSRVGLTSIPGPKPRLGSCGQSRQPPLWCQLARMARRPGGQSALAQALWCQLGLDRPGLGKKAHVNPGATTPAPSPTAAPLPGSSTRADLEGHPAEGWDSLVLALQLLRSETVKVYVNNEINILVSFF